MRQHGPRLRDRLDDAGLELHSPPQRQRLVRPSEGSPVAVLVGHFTFEFSYFVMLAPNVKCMTNKALFYSIISIQLYILKDTTASYESDESLVKEMRLQNFLDYPLQDAR